MKEKEINVRKQSTEMENGKKNIPENMEENGRQKEV